MNNPIFSQETKFPYMFIKMHVRFRAIKTDIKATRIIPKFYVVFEPSVVSFSMNHMLCRPTLVLHLWYFSSIFLLYSGCFKR